ncbi:MAG: hypothetical protein HY775_08260, partial [Acidobacteria bacterium]|nr:hypothetical protein [Acidobacteriota bacterium]
MSRPTADAGVEQALRVTFLPGGGIAPTVPDPVAPESGNLRAHVRLDGRESSDPNRPPLPLTYAWVQTAGTTVTLAGALTATPTFVPPREGEYGFALTVHNGQFQSPPARVRVIVSATNAPPTAQAAALGAGADGAFLAGRDPVTLDGSLSTDPDPGDAGSLHYAWRQATGRTVMLLDAVSGTASTTAPRVRFVPESPGVATFALTVTDRAGAAGPPVEVVVHVRPENVKKPALSLLASATTTSDQGEDLGDPA